MLCDEDSRRALPVLEKMVARWRKADPKEAEELKSQCLRLADAIINQWPENQRASSYDEKVEPNNLLKLLSALGDAKLASRFIGEALVKDVSADPGKFLVEACQKLGWESTRDELEVLFRATNAESLPKKRAADRGYLPDQVHEKGGLEPALQDRRARPGCGRQDDRQPGRSPRLAFPRLDRTKILSGLARAGNHRAIRPVVGLPLAHLEPA